MELIQAVAEGNGERVRSLLSGMSEAGVNKPGRNKTTPLMAAAIQGDADIAKMLLEAGAKLDLQDADSQTALMHAICQRNDAIVDLLLNAGARPDVENWLAFDFAVRFGKLTLVKRLIDLGADVDCRVDGEDPTPLMEAVSRGNMELVQMLLDVGADVTAAAEGGQTALSLAAERGNQPIFDLLLESGCPPGPALAGAVFSRNLPMARKMIELGADVNATDKEFNYSLLSTAVDNGDAKMARLLLKAGAEVDTRDWMGQSPLWTAAIYGRARIARILMDAGADPNVCDDNGVTLLAEVASIGQEKVLESLLKHGADPNVVTGHSPAPLLHAVASGSVPITRTLLEAGAAADAAVPKMKKNWAFEGCPPGTTALMIAARDGRIELVDLLLASGADVHATNSKGQTATDFAVKEGHTTVLDRLTAVGAPVNRKSKRLQNAVLIRASETGDLPGVRTALAAGARPDATRKKNGATPLMHAALDGHVEIVQALLDAGADPNRISQWGENALRSAVVRGHTEIVRILLASGGDPNMQYAEGSVPSGERNTVIGSLHSPLCDAAQLGHSEILEILLNAGADVNATSDSGIGPLLAAVYGRRHDLARRLLDAGAQPREEDADYLAVLDWERASDDAAFVESVEEVAQACGAKAEPMDWLPGAQSFRLAIPGRGEEPGADVVDQTEAIVAWSKQWNQDYTALAKHVDSVLDDLAKRVAERGYHLIDAGMPLGCGPMSRFLVLLPTSDKYGILAAFGVRGNDMELSNREIIAWLRELDREAPFVLRGCKFDTVSIELEEPLKDPKRWANEFCEFCPDSFDSDELDYLIEQLRSTTKLTFWWD